MTLAFEFEIIDYHNLPKEMIMGYAMDYVEFEQPYYAFSIELISVAHFRGLKKYDFKVFRIDV